MRETNSTLIEYEKSESTETIAPTTTEATIAEMDIEDFRYGKDKPRRIEIRRKIVHDSG